MMKTLARTCLLLALVGSAVAIDLASLHTQRMDALLQDGSDRIYLHTCYGAIPIKLLTENAPNTCARIKAMASAGDCPGCAFYRNEARPSPTEGLGPPYGLLQGRLAFSEGEKPDGEGSLTVRERSVASLPGTDDFFISLVDHSDWGTSHVVWGELEDWFAVDMIVAQRYSDVVHPEHGTHMRILLDEMAFRLSDAENTAPKR